MNLLMLMADHKLMMLIIMLNIEISKILHRIFF